MLGGRALGCNTELHDTVFVTGHSLEETYPSLIKKWFGITKRLHIDSSIELQYVDGHEIVMNKEKPSEDKKLFFVNFGAYQPDYFGEVHQVGFYVDTSKSAVLVRAKSDLCVSLLEPHCDDSLPVDDIIAIDQVDQHYIHLVPTTKTAKLMIQSTYRRLDVPVGADLCVRPAFINKPEVT
jgi:hypothetical protein